MFETSVIRFIGFNLVSSLSIVTGSAVWWNGSGSQQRQIEDESGRTDWCDFAQIVLSGV
jgi:hypothetical protein